MAVLPVGDAPALERIPIYVTSSGGRRLNPSPATYEPQKAFGAETIPVHIRPRLPEAPQERRPAPGDYETFARFGDGQKGCQILVANDRSPYRPNANPAPGNYNIPPSSSPTRITIGSAAKRLKQDEIPGPGHYNPVSPRQRGCQIHEGPRSPYQINTTPGPGSSDIPPAPSMPKVTIGSARREPAHDDIPDPGSYDPAAQALTPGPVIHERHTRAREANAVPGPGTYDDPRRIRPNPGCGRIYGRPAPRYGDDMGPAPGSYDPHRPFGADSPGPMFPAPPRRSQTSLGGYPGPGEYSPEMGRTRSAAIRMSRKDPMQSVRARSRFDIIHK
jgi:hypothetical protein